MAFYDKFPYSNFHELNTDWIIQKIKHIDDSVEASAASASASDQSAQASAASANASDQSAQASAASAEASAGSAEDAAESAAGIEAAREQIYINTARLDNLIVDGTPTEGNTELLDIRVGGNGVTYPTAGDAVRGQYNAAINSLAGIKSSILDYDETEVSPTWETGYPSLSDGKTMVIDSNFKTTDYIPVATGCIVHPAGFEAANAIYFYRLDKSFIGYTTHTGDIIVDEDTCFLRFATKATLYETVSITISSKINKIVNGKTAKIQLFGDSITDDVWGDHQTWVSFINTYLPKNIYDLTVVNSAVAGSRMGSGYSGDGRYSDKSANFVYDLITDGTLETDSDLIIILIGTNNWSNATPLGTLADDGTGISFYGWTRACLDYISEHTTANVIIATPPQRYYSWDAGRPVNAYGEPLNTINLTLRDYCDALKNCAKLYGFECVDLNADLGWNILNVSNFTVDGVHPNGTGDKILSKMLCNAIKAKLYK